ncbi:MAG: hypothetical protein GEU99_11435 [Luteitalea sp.]|nr:hypothetical protein [Luteitalea sp.]
MGRPSGCRMAFVTSRGQRSGVRVRASTGSRIPLRLRQPSSLAPGPFAPLPMLTLSYKRRVVVAAGAVLGFFLLYEDTILDSRYAANRVESPERAAWSSGARAGNPRGARPTGARLRFSATAYCKGTTTASGAAVRRGIAAADPALLPVGSVIQVDSVSARYDGVYTVMDTGPKVQGRLIDLYMWSCHEALRFGRRAINLTVLRLGWSPGSTDRAKKLFHLRERNVMLSSFMR